MKTPLRVAAAVFLVLLVGGLGASGLLAVEVSQDLQDGFALLTDSDSIQNDSKAFYEANLPSMLADPSYDNLARVWASRERAQLGKDAFDEFKSRKRKLGLIQDCGAVMSTMDYTFKADEGLFHRSKRTEISGDFSNLCHFANGSAELKWSLLKEGDGWGFTALELSHVAISPVSRP